MIKRVTIDFVSNGSQCCFYDCGAEARHFNIYKDEEYLVSGDFCDLNGMDESELLLQTGIPGLIKCRNNIVKAKDLQAVFLLISKNI